MNQPTQPALTVVSRPQPKVKVTIGSNFRGVSDLYRDTRDGTYWEVLPQLSDGDMRIQRALLAHGAKARKQAQREAAKARDAADWALA